MLPAGVSLATVAAELDLATTALYRYVDSKDVLVELMVDQAIGGRYPALAGSVARGWSDVDRELDFALGLVLRGAAAGG